MNYPNDLSPVIFSKDMIFMIKEIFYKAQELENVSQQKCFWILGEDSLDDAISFRQFYKIINSEESKKLNFLTAQFLLKCYFGILVKNSIEAEDKLKVLNIERIKEILDNADSTSFLKEIRSLCKKDTSHSYKIIGKSKDNPRALLRMPSRYYIYGFIILCLILFGIIKLSDNDKSIFQDRLEKVRYKDKVLSALNQNGEVLWQKKFDFPISKAFVYKTDNNNEAIKYPNIEKFIIIFLENPRHRIFDPEISIQSGKCDNKIVVIGSTGNVLFDYELSNFHRSLEFVKISQINKFFEGNIDHDNNIENIFWISNYGMYPSSFVYRKGLKFYTFVNPGHFNDYRILYNNNKEASFLIFGFNNPIAHLKFISETKFVYTSSEQRIHSIGNISKREQSQISEFISFLPSNCRITDCSWEQNGEIVLFDRNLNCEIILNKNYQMAIKSGDKVTVFKDDPDQLKAVYKLLDRFFMEKKLRKNNKSAYNLILNALKFKISNPYLKSAILYLKGDLEVELGEFKKGTATLMESLDLYPFNNDSCQRLCEIEFLKGEPLNAIRCTKGKLYDTDYHNIMKFWGLSSGKKIFQLFCHLQEGDFTSAQSIIITEHLDYKGNYILDSISTVFSGDYITALKYFKQNKAKSQLPFTIAQKRLIYARALLLKNLFSEKKNQKEIKRATFYFKDLATNSLSEGHLAKVSYAYFLAKEKRFTESGNLLKTSYNKIVNKSKGNFDTRLWLFYDSFIYAKTMELLGNTEEMKKGYLECIKANPHTDLAKRAEKRLENLKD